MAAVAMSNTLSTIKLPSVSEMLQENINKKVEDSRKNDAFET